MGQMKLANHDLYIDTEVVFVTQNFDHPAKWILRRGRPVRDFYFDHHVFQIFWINRVRFLTQNPMWSSFDGQLGWMRSFVLFGTVVFRNFLTRRDMDFLRNLSVNRGY